MQDSLAAHLTSNPLRLIRHPVYGIIELHPFRKQWQYIELYRRVTKIAGWDGPNRPGKSMAATMLVVELLTGWPIESWATLPWDLGRHPMGPPRHIGCITVTLAKSIQEQQRDLAQRLPRYLLRCKPWSEKTGFGGHNPTLVLANGSTVHFLSDMQPEQTLESFQWDAAWIDEAVDEWVAQRVIARLADVGGKLLITAVAEKAWIHRLLRLHMLDPAGNQPAPAGMIETISDSTMYDNELIDPQYVAQSIALWGGPQSREARMRVWGQYVLLEGVVLDTYDDIAHVEDTFEPPDHWTRYEYADPGYVNPFAWGFVAVDPDGVGHVYDEIYERRKSVAEVAELVKRKRMMHGLRGPCRAADIDPAADAKKFWGKEVRSVRQELSDCGIQTAPAIGGEGSVEAGCRVIRAALRAGRLRVQRHCTWHRFEFMNYRWPDFKPGQEEFYGDREKPVDEHNHLIGGLRYAYSRGIPYIPLAEPPPRGSPAWDMLQQERARAAAEKSLWSRAHR